MSVQSSPPSTEMLIVFSHNYVNIDMIVFHQKQHKGHQQHPPTVTELLVVRVATKLSVRRCGVEKTERKAVSCVKVNVVHR
jgi:hypothetical protein